MIRITWQGQATPPQSVTATFQKRLTNFILEKIEGLITEIESENGYFDITDAENPEQLSIIPKDFSPALTKKILRHFAE